MTPNNGNSGYVGVENQDSKKDIRHDGFTPPKTIEPPPKPQLPKTNNQSIKHNGRR